MRLSIPVRTFSDWDDPAPGFAEADLVAHSGPVTRGSFVQTLVVTDIATGWIECAPVLYREQTLLREVPGEVRKLMPFELLGFDTDNDTEQMNDAIAAMERGPLEPNERERIERIGAYLYGQYSPAYPDAGDAEDVATGRAAK